MLRHDLSKLSAARPATLAISLLAALAGDAGDASAAPRQAPREFQAVEIRLEFSKADADAEIVTTIDAGVGLKFVDVIAPHGREVMHLSAHTMPRLGQTKITAETPEPSLADVQASYPPGVYRFRGRTVDGQAIVGEAELSHDLPDAPIITAPQAGQTNVGLKMLLAAWDPAGGAARYAVVLEQEDLGIKLTADLLAGSTNFAVPEGWLLPDMDYVLEVVAIGENGNRSVGEVRFHTGK